MKIDYNDSQRLAQQLISADLDPDYLANFIYDFAGKMSEPLENRISELESKIRELELLVKGKENG